MTKQATTYNELQQQLDEIIIELQSGDLSLDESLDRYKQAEELIQAQENYLKNAKNKINKVVPKIKG